MAIYDPHVLSFQGQLINWKNQRQAAEIDKAINAAHGSYSSGDTIIKQADKAILILTHMIAEQKEGKAPDDGHVIGWICPSEQFHPHNLPRPYQASLAPAGGGYFREFVGKRLYTLRADGIYVGKPGNSGNSNAATSRAMGGEGSKDGGGGSGRSQADSQKESQVCAHFVTSDAIRDCHERARARESGVSSGDASHWSTGGSGGNGGGGNGGRESVAMQRAHAVAPHNPAHVLLTAAQFDAYIAGLPPRT